MARRLRQTGVALALLVLAACQQATPHQAQQVIALDEWRQAAPLAYTFGAVTVTVHALSGPEGETAPEIRIAGPNGASARHLGFAQFGIAAPRLIVTEMDRANAAPEFLLSQYSGGAHCCDVLTLFHLNGGQWRILDAGSWDGGGILPADLDGDGATEIQTRDDRFLYRFASYAESTPPSLIFGLANGALQDMSADPRFRHVHQQDAAQLQAMCAQRANGACAAMVAAAARLGSAALEAAWAFMLTHHDPDSAWDLSQCDSYGADGQCAQWTRHRDFPAALHSFLRETGYVAKDWSG